MIKTPQDRSDRTYSVPSAGHIGGISAQGPGSGGGSNNFGGGQNGGHQNHNYMLPLSPGGGGNAHHHGGHQGSSITPKTTTHAQMQQRQSINEGLMQANGDRGGQHMIQGQGPNNTHVGSSIKGN